MSNLSPTEMRVAQAYPDFNRDDVAAVANLQGALLQAHSDAAEAAINSDTAAIEAVAVQDYEHYLGKVVLVNAVSGYIGNSSTDIPLNPPAKVRVEATSLQVVKRWIDNWCDPIYEVSLVESHPQLHDVRSLWIYGPSRHLNGKQTEASDIVSVVDTPAQHS